LFTLPKAFHSGVLSRAEWYALLRAALQDLFELTRSNALFVTLPFAAKLLCYTKSLNLFLIKLRRKNAAEQGCGWRYRVVESYSEPGTLYHRTNKKEETKERRAIDKSWETKSQRWVVRAASRRKVGC